MTESEAHTKWCPLARVAAADALGIIDGGKPAHNRAYAVLDHARIDIASSNCIASACMFWRTQEIQMHPSGVSADDETASPSSALTRTDGFCGVAGVMFRGVRG